MVKYNRFGDDSSSYRSRSRSVSRSSSYPSSRSSFTSNDDESDDYRRGVALIERLLNVQNTPATDDSVAPSLQELSDLFKLMNSRDRTLLEEYLKRNACASLRGVVPGTVGAQLCGCFVRGCRDGKIGCTASCADSFFFSGRECPDTIIHWAMTDAGPASRVIKRGNSNCRVYIDPGFSATSEQKAEYLASLGCQTISHYDSITNNPSSTATPQPINPPATTLPAAPVTNSPVGQTNATAVSGAPDNSSTWLWWVIVVFVLLIILAVVFYLYAF